MHATLTLSILLRCFCINHPREQTYARQNIILASQGFLFVFIKLRYEISKTIQNTIIAPQ